MSNDEFCQRVWDMNDAQLLALWKWACLLYQYRALRRCVPGVQPACPALDGPTPPRGENPAPEERTV